MHALQALALSAEEQRAYVSNNPTGMIGEYRHWLTILQGRHDWKPTDRQQQSLMRLHMALDAVHEPKIAWHDAESFSDHEARVNEAARGELDNDEWCAVRKNSLETLHAFRWKQEVPPESAFHQSTRLQGMSVRTIEHRFNSAINELEIVRRLPGMFFLGGADGAVNFLLGYTSAIQALALSSKRIWDYVVRTYTSRGWERNNLVTEPIPQMQKRGWSDDAMVDEIICIYIDALSQVLIDEGLMEE